MGGIGSGGHPLVGRKRQSRAMRALVGAESPKERQAARNTVQITEFEAPNELTTDERNVWLRLAPGAFKAQTLTKATEYAFIVLCRNVLLEQKLRADVEQCGGANHRGILQRMELGLVKFGIAPVGKPMLDSEHKPEDPFAEFDGQAVN